MDSLAENINGNSDKVDITKVSEDIIREPLDKNHVRLGAFVVEAGKRPDEAAKIESDIAKTYEGQEFVGEDSLKALGNE